MEQRLTRIKRNRNRIFYVQERSFTFRYSWRLRFVLASTTARSNSGIQNVSQNAAEMRTDAVATTAAARIAM